jgi:carboxymethylenebutenolidase
MKDHISVNGRDGTFAAYIVKPKTSPAPAVVVLHEVFGVNADIRKTCDELADQGFIAVAPDLFWRQEPGVDLNVSSEADWEHGLRLYGAYDRVAGTSSKIENYLGFPTGISGKELAGRRFGSLRLAAYKRTSFA